MFCSDAPQQSELAVTLSDDHGEGVGNDERAHQQRNASKCPQEVVHEGQCSFDLLGGLLNQCLARFKLHSGVLGAEAFADAIGRRAVVKRDTCLGNMLPIGEFLQVGGF